MPTSDETTKAGGPSPSSPTFSDWSKPIDSDPADGRAFDFPSTMARLPNGTIVHLHRVGNQHGKDSGAYIVKRFSNDDGQTWTMPELVVDTPGKDDRNLGGGVTDQGTLIFPYSHPTHQADSWLRSTDNGLTFISRDFDSPVLGNFQPSLIVIPEQGRIALVTDSEVSGGNKLILLFSSDDGLTFPPDDRVDIPVGFRPVEAVGQYLGGGKFIIVFAGPRTRVGNYYQVTSSDFGATWSSPQHTNIPTGGGARGGAMTLTSGNKLFLLYRFGGAPSEPFYALADADTVFNDPNAWETGSITPGKVGDGYGGVVELGDGRLLLTYSFEDVPQSNADHDLEYVYAAIGDTTPPAQILDLAVSGVGTDYALLEWTAPGDNGTEGRATVYDLRFSTMGPLDQANFTAGTPVAVVTPRIAGTVQVLRVTGLAPGTQYWFAIRTADEVFNWSPVSNGVIVQTE